MEEPIDDGSSFSIKKSVYLIIGSIALAIGFVGIFLPVLPTTPFVLLAAWCFFRSSPRLYEWVISNERFGDTIKNYNQGKGLTRATKIKAILMMWLTISTSIYFKITSLPIIAFLFGIAMVVTIYLIRLPTLEL
jgi:uncharacterized membrane protein YbaN (DUF454 family)